MPKCGKERYNHSSFLPTSSQVTCLFSRRRTQLVFRVFRFIQRLIFFSFHTFRARFFAWIKPSSASLVLGTLSDLTRGKAELLAENALLRQQLIILRRQIKQPIYRKTDRLLLLLLARMVRTWKQTLFLVQPETLLRLPSRALPGVLETQIKGAHKKAEALARDDYLDQGDGGKQSPSSELSGFVVNSSSWIFG